MGPHGAEMRGLQVERVHYEVWRALVQKETRIRSR